MAEIFGAIQKALGVVLSGIYEVIPSYGVAIVLLTVVARVVLIPLTVKQIRSMSAMSKVQPELKKLQQKHKGDRQKLNEEVMKLYKEHGVNPLGGCLPLLMQAPVFIALYSVLRASIMVLPMTLTPVGQAVEFTAAELKNVVCRPVETPTYAGPAPSGPNPSQINCSTVGGKAQTFEVADFRDFQNFDDRVDEVSWISSCAPTQEWANGGDPQVACRSALGTGHLPLRGDLFADITADRAQFLGMHLACSATQVQSREGVRQCTRDEGHAGGGNLVPYWIVIALFIGSTYYQTKQMASRATGQQAAQQKMMARIMPVFLGFISLGIPAGVNVYWLTSNLWGIGQQGLMLAKMDAESAPAEVVEEEPPAKPKGSPPQQYRKKKKGKR